MKRERNSTRKVRKNNLNDPMKREKNSTRKVRSDII
jgi:hypothetical protein